MKRLVTLPIAMVFFLSFIVYSAFSSDTDPGAPSTNTVIKSTADITGKTLIDPDTMYAYQVKSIDTLIATIIFGDLPEGPVAYIDPSSIRVNDTLAPLSWQILPSHPDFTGEVMEITINLNQFLLFTYVPFWDTTVQTYTVSGRYAKRCEFEVTGEVTLFGHTTGDVNNDGQVNVSDATYLVDYLFQGGAAPPVLETADVNHDGSVNIVDVTAMLKLLFG
jgi:hypothetical protein